jgi:hypothetical protein
MKDIKLTNFPDALVTLTASQLSEMLQKSFDDGKDNASSDDTNLNAIEFLNIKKDSGVMYLGIDAAIFLLNNPDCQGYSHPIENNKIVIKEINCINQ